MYIALETIDEWFSHDDFAPERFFLALGELLQDNDCLVMGSYDAGPEATDWLDAHGIALDPASKPWFETWEFNRDEYPKGRDWMLSPTVENFSTLADLPKADSGSGDGKKLFFDHVLAYREGNPTIPLFDYHDAFMGGWLRLSGHYRKEIVARFGERLGTQFELRYNQESPQLKDLRHHTTNT